MKVETEHDLNVLLSFFFGLCPPICGKAMLFRLVAFFIRGYAAANFACERLVVGDSAAKPQEKKAAVGEAELHRKLSGKAAVGLLFR